MVDVLIHLGEELQADPDFSDAILEPLEILGVDQFADSAVIIKARITTKPIQQWRVGREFNRRMKKRFDELGIEISFPHQTVYFGEDRSGNAPAVRVALAEDDPSAATGKKPVLAADRLARRSRPGARGGARGKEGGEGGGDY